MFHMRGSGTEASKKRNTLQLIQFAASNADIPLNRNWEERWCTLSEGFKDVMEEILNFEVRSDDVFVVTYMKCGTTWMQEAAWLLMNDLNFEGAKQSSILERAPFLDWMGLFKHLPNSIETVNNLASPRLIKTHLPANLLPKQIWKKHAKIIYVARNVKDMVVSAYDYLTNFGIWHGSMDEFIEDLLNNDIIYMPYLDRVIEFWQMRDVPNVCFVTYEDMQRDLRGILKRLCSFLNKPELNPEQLDKVLDHLSFESMKENKRTNLTEELKSINPDGVSKDFQFMRHGVVGLYRDELTLTQQRLLDEKSKSFFSEYGLTEKDIFGPI